MQFPKPPKTEKKAPSAIKRTVIKRKDTWKPLRRQAYSADTGAAQANRALPQAS